MAILQGASIDSWTLRANDGGGHWSPGSSCFGGKTMCRDVTALFSASDHGMRSTKASEVQGGFSGLVVRWNMYSKMELTIDDGVLLVAVVVLVVFLQPGWIDFFYALWESLDDPSQLLKVLKKEPRATPATLHKNIQYPCRGPKRMRPHRCCSICRNCNLGPEHFAPAPVDLQSNWGPPSVDRCMRFHATRPFCVERLCF